MNNYKKFILITLLKSIRTSIVFNYQKELFGKNKHLFGKYLTFGLVFLLIFQTILNLCVVVGLVPVTGVTLPFISYGGSSLVVSMICIGIILNICEK